MQSLRKRLGLGMVMLILATLLAACGANNTATNEAASQTNNAELTPSPSASPTAATEEKATRIYKSVKGDVEIPTNPKRIVADQYLQTLLALGVKPVGADQYYIDNPYTKDLAVGIEGIGDRSGINLEKVVSLEPDLIITANEDANVYDQLSKIAPTISIPFGTNATFKGVHAEMRGIAELLGKQAEAESWLTAYDAKIEELRGKLSGKVGKDETFTIFESGGKTTYTFGDNFGRGGQAIYGALQLQPTERIRNELFGDTQWKELSLEVLPEYAGDYILLFSEVGNDEFKQTEIWNSMDAVKNNHVLELAADRFWYFDPVSILAQAEEITAMLIGE
ncbi:iron-hydroxamate ABC transporter substrate-binding protein [Paenibacillus sinopodophylli]|uniref:iron-hydroxamate ABC transporter substrate-binding protein n=1 Tax=Paenibacillus sinopodophylli TaxID=1837342 RepID=UPI001485FD64|nr:iron-hydroxamate ABC transporter substrate-binding protein [Paenibacillus sinopodophylli]